MYTKKFVGIKTKNSFIKDKEITETMVFVSVYNIYLFGIKIGTEEVLIKN